MPVWASQIAVGLFSTGAAAVLRAFIEIAAAGAAAFALVYPAVLLATLFGRWQAGVVALASAFVLVWYYLVPVEDSFVFATALGARETAANFVVAGIVIIITETFRQAVRRAVDERNSKIAERDLLLAEFDHRTKNNFMVVASLLQMQRRRAQDQQTKDALTDAAQRILGVAAAHRHLYRHADDPGQVEMKTYLENLCASLADALFLHGDVQIVCKIEQTILPSDRAVSLGLIVNELVTNAAKHAFVDRPRGEIVVEFSSESGKSVLTVADDGRGFPQENRADGLGAGLVDAFAAQAGARIRRDSSENGARVTIEMEI